MPYNPRGNLRPRTTVVQIVEEKYNSAFTDYSSCQLFPTPIDIRHIKNSRLKDCELLSAIISIASHPYGKEFIYEMMCEPPQPNVRVIKYVYIRLFDDDNKPFYIKVYKNLPNDKDIPIERITQIFPGRLINPYLTGRIFTIKQNMPILWLRLLEKAFSMFDVKKRTIIPVYPRHKVNTKKIFLTPDFSRLEGIDGVRVFHFLLSKDRSNTEEIIIKHNIQEIVDSGPSATTTFQKLMTRSAKISSNEIRDIFRRCSHPNHSYTAWNIWLGSLPQDFKSAEESKDTCINPVFKQYKTRPGDNFFQDFPPHSPSRCSYDPHYAGNVYRFKDFTKFLEMHGRTLDDNIKMAVINWVKRTQALPGKRNSGIYTTDECELFNDITEFLADIKKRLIYANTYERSTKTIDKKTGNNINLLGNHAYAIVATKDDKNIKSVKIIDSCWLILPTFIDLHDLTKYFATIVFADFIWTPMPVNWTPTPVRWTPVPVLR